MPYGSGHINDTYLASYQSGTSVLKFIHQRINHHVFHDPVALMKNFETVTGHIESSSRSSRASDIDRRVLSLVRSRDGRSFVYDSEGYLWRTTRFISGTKTYDIVGSPALAFEVGRCYGDFQLQLLTLSPENLLTTIPDFHNTRQRFNVLQQAIESDPRNRSTAATDEIAYAMARESYVDRLDNLFAAGRLPERITHNDTKVNNLLVDNLSGKGICVTDLDTTMPGLAGHDFGDMVRTATNKAAEDVLDHGKVKMRMEIFKPLVKGYLSEASQFLTPMEIEQLVFSCKVMVLESGIRFLTDHLLGDVYFKTQRRDHNLDRCRVQFKLLSSIEEQEELMELVVKSISDQ
ncbi:MAG TPA: aminoglycoside phosphotransferase family protein [candidate division Zixibacteria bacterium]|nr:aminoglycoside phosphotransferase family protein [candidate division Zixibacteria bacterium]